MKSINAFFDQAMRLKQLKRSGWHRCGVEPCESVAEHSFGVSVLALVLAQAAKVDRGKCLALAVVHDLAEAIVGDITPLDGIDSTEKQRRERDGLRQMTSLLEGSTDLLTLWEEYETGDSPEAQLVRELDALEMAWQASSYVRHGVLDIAAAQEFIASARQRVKSDVGLRVLEQLTKT